MYCNIAYTCMASVSVKANMTKPASVLFVIDCQGLSVTVSYSATCMYVSTACLILIQTFKVSKCHLPESKEKQTYMKSFLKQ